MENLSGFSVFEDFKAFLNVLKKCKNSFRIASARNEGAILQFVENEKNPVCFFRKFMILCIQRIRIVQKLHVALAEKSGKLQREPECKINGAD